MMMERTSMGVPGMGYPGMGTPTTGMPTGTPMSTNWMMVPRCTYRLEKCSGGFKMYCQCDDKMAASMVQNLCTMLAGGMCSCYAMFNGMTVYYCNLTMGLCKCESVEDGVCVTCTSGDPHCCEMIQACCDCLSSMLNAGCTCCFLMNSTPVCCGCCEPSKVGSKPKTSR
jgi:hypothetical protein